MGNGAADDDLAVEESRMLRSDVDPGQHGILSVTLFLLAYSGHSIESEDSVSFPLRRLA
jgi:hypothetical protein